MIWAIDHKINEVEMELRSIQESKAIVHESIGHTWSDNLGADAIVALLARARDCEQRDRQLERRLERLHAKQAMITDHLAILTR
jgi:ubiquinone biosynthesis protein UbiJ